jgi:hypothetical protein
MSTPKIFLSSTFVDLSAVRDELRKWLAGLFGVQLVVMETFGSDAAPPEINSIRRVRECDLFVGIYAHRYGTIDKNSGKSITELELDEANSARSAGILRDILLFVIDEDSNWLSEHKETKPPALLGLTRLREKANLHSYTSFRNRDELLFRVMCDVYEHISQFMNAPPPIVRSSTLPQTKPLDRPIGMEYLTSEHREFLLGRDSDISHLMTLLSSNHIVLLLGDSGIGKTSLIHAGLIPAAVQKGWRVVPSRPLGLPCTDISRILLASVFEGRPIYTGSMIPLFGEITRVTQGQTLLLIIDQFEDVLLSRDEREVQNLLSDLRIFRNAAPPSIRILLSYRSDLEGRVGQYWQYISGSPSGLPRFYLKGISVDQAWQSLEMISQSLGITLALREEEKERLRNDLFAASSALGFDEVYPPYIQMTVDHLWSMSRNGKYHFESYQEAGGMDGIIAGYLGHLLKYAQDTKGNVRATLVSLVRSYGVKAQKELKEIIADTGLNERDCEQILEQLIDLRLVRHIPPFYEISHDFIARRIANELVGLEELEFKRFHELLTSKAAAFRTTRSLLSTEEQLILYKHRHRLIPTDEESHLLLSTWVRIGGPGLFWLLSVDKNKVISWLRGEEAEQDLKAEARASAVLLRRKLGEMPLSEKDYQAFRNYQLSAELATLILESAVTLPTKLLVFGLRHKRKEVREACIECLVERSKQGNWDWIKLLRNSTSVPLQEAFDELVLRPEVPAPDISLESNRLIKEFRLLKLITKSTSQGEAKKFYNDYISLRSRRRLTLFAQSLLAAKQGRLSSLLKKAKRASSEKAKTILKTPRCTPSCLVFDRLLQMYCQWNTVESSRYDRSSINAKTGMLASTINAIAITKYLPHLRKYFKRIRLTPSSREIMHALLRIGDDSDVKFILDRIAKEKCEIEYWNHTELGRTAGNNMERTAKGIPRFLAELVVKKEFTHYIDLDERNEANPQDILPLVNTDNKTLYIRIAAYSAIGAATSDNLDNLDALANHQYGMIARTAAVKLVRLLGSNSLRRLSSNIDDAIQQGRSSLCAEAIRYAEMELYNVACSI